MSILSDAKDKQVAQQEETKCGLCPMDGTQMTPSENVPGYCYCPKCEQMHRGVQVKKAG